MIRPIFSISSLLVVLALVPAGDIGKIERSIGGTVSTAGGAESLANAGTPLHPNDILRTGALGAMRVTLDGGSTLLLGENTELRVVTHDPEAQKTLVEMLQGHVHAEVIPTTKPGGAFIVKTPTASVTAVGTSFDVQTTNSGPTGGSMQVALQENGQPVAAADVALVLANMNKVSLGKTDDQGTMTSALDLANEGKAQAGSSTALDLANLGKVQLHAEVDGCDDGSRQVYLVSADGTLPPPAPKCKRRRLAGFFFWGDSQRVTFDLARGTSEVTRLSSQTNSTTPTTQPTGPQSLSQIPSDGATGTGNPRLSDYARVTTTVVVGLDHFAAVTNFNTNIPGIVLLMPGQATTVTRGAPPQTPVPVSEVNPYTQVSYRTGTSKPTGANNGFFGGSVTDFGSSGAPCQPAVVVNGATFTGGANPAYSYKITGLGTSTGEALQIEITNEAPCPLYFSITDGTIVHPKGFTGRVVTGLLLGGSPSLKDFQKMITMGVFVRVAAGSPAAGTHVTIPLRSYCVELHKLAPHPKTEYRFGDASDQGDLGNNRTVVDRTVFLTVTRQMQIAQGHTLDGVVQWSLWTKIEGFDEKKFMDEFMSLVHKNAEAQKKKWDKTAEQQADALGHSLWGNVQTVLR